MKNNYTVYMHTFPNGKKYIGITSQNINRRWRTNGAGYSKKTQSLVYNAIRKYGWENIKHEILFEKLDETSAKNKEIKLIHDYKTFNRRYGYNRTIGGDTNPMVGKHHTKKSLFKISQHSKGANNPAAKKVYQYDLDGNLIAEYSTAKEAARITGINFAGISKCRAGSRPSAGGFIWRYKLEKNVKKITHYFKRPIIQYDLQDNLIKEWESAANASRELQIDRKGIVNACLGISKTSNGYKWKYKIESLG